MDRLAQDLRVALRGLRQAPVFAATVLVILGLGIGMSVAMFTVFRAVLVQRLPVLDQDHVVVLWTVREGDVEAGAGRKSIDQFRHETRTLRAVAGVAHWGATSFPLKDGDRALVLQQSIVDGNFFDVLGARPVLGRLLSANDDRGGKFQPASAKGLDHAIVLSYDTWKRQFGGDTGVIGHHLIDPYSQWSYTIVGVAPAGLDYPAGVGCWVTAGKDSDVGMIAIGRLGPGSGPAAARAEYFAVIQRLAPGLHLTGAIARTLPDQMLGEVRPAIIILTAAVGLLLLIACVDVANLMLLRTAGRGREIAIRRAIGARFSDVVGHLVVESAVLGVGGGLLGLGCAELLLRILLELAPTELPRTDVIGVGGAPVALAAGTTLVAVLCFGVLPALAATGGDIASRLRVETRAGGESRDRRRLRTLLVTSQVALAFALVAGAGLLVRSLTRLQHLDLGFTAHRLSIISLSWPADKYDTLPKLYALGDALFTRIRAVPGVTGVTPVIIPPFIGPNVWQWSFEIEGRDLPAQERPIVPMEGAGSQYFYTFDIPIIRGPGFSPADVVGAPLEVVVSEDLARRIWPGQDAIGKRIRFGYLPDSTWRVVVGVVRDIHFRSLREATPTVFLRWRQSWWQGFLAVRTVGTLTSTLPAIRAAAHDIDPGILIWSAESMDDYLATGLAGPRFNALLLSGFGLVSLLLAALGLYGVMASAVSQQTREIGVRMALGATAERVRREIIRSALSVTLIGVLIGAFIALTASKVLSALLFGISPTDPLTLAGACILLLGTGFAAAYLPAYRATKIDPTRALRAE